MKRATNGRGMSKELKVIDSLKLLQNIKNFEIRLAISRPADGKISSDIIIEQLCFLLCTAHGDGMLCII